MTRKGHRRPSASVTSAVAAINGGLIGAADAAVVLLLLSLSAIVSISITDVHIHFSSSQSEAVYQHAQLLTHFTVSQN